MVAGVTLLMRWMLLPASLVVGLAAVLRMAEPVTGGHGDIGGVIRLPRPVTGAILALCGLAVVVMAVGLARRMRSRRGQGSGEDEPVDERLPTLTQILSLVNFVVLAYLIWRGVIPLAELLNFGQGAVSGIGAMAAESP